jgi:hypothetical protein
MATTATSLSLKTKGTGRVFAGAPLSFFRPSAKLILR